MPTCPECGGEFKFDRMRFMYICRACGLSMTREEYEAVRRSKGLNVKEDEREQMRKEYLRWWLKKK
ncbi:MAG: hypothetical protein QXK12_05685 [Candidatus Nezhaarchaeales archaeon]